ncbi:MAG: sugar transferase, partial [Lentisphaerae bacterium]|nr:sugar transferase [Lentisphaerota bacterium]
MSPQKKKSLGRRGGYLPVYDWLRQAGNRGLAAVLLTAIAPLLAVMYILRKTLGRDGEAFLYRGTRLGKNKQPFKIYKLCTLKSGSEQAMGSDLMREGNGREVRFGGFMRRTRLDELPQLLNILKGDMYFVGPRPVRPVVYEKVREQIHGYDRRFIVKPGLTGYAQLFTPHGTPKRLRSFIDNRFCRSFASPVWDLLLVTWTGLQFLRATVTELVADGTELAWNTRRHRGVGRQRQTKRIASPNIGASVAVPGREEYIAAKVVNVNAGSVLVEISLQVRQGDRVKIRIGTLVGPAHRMSKTAHCRGTV